MKGQLGSVFVKQNDAFEFFLFITYLTI